MSVAPLPRLLSRARTACTWTARLALACAFSADDACAQGDEAAAPRPNILFVLVDDQRDDTLGCAGHPVVQTPTIDALAADGVRFTNVFVSHSICWVSRASILTGLTARSYGQEDEADRVRTEVLAGMFPRLLRAAGYRTAHFGKFHARMPQGWQRGDDFDAFVGIHRNPYFKEQPDGSLRHETELIADHAIDFLAQQDAEQPFAINLWFNAAHAEDGDHRPGIGHFPWPRAVDGLYEDQDMPPPRLGDPAIFAAQPEYLRTSILRERWHWRWDTPEKYQTNMRAYLRMISGIDHAVGRVLAALEERGLAESTIVVYSADNGYFMGDRGFAGKWAHYEESLRVPLIVHDPRPQADATRGTTVDAIALNLDLPASFLAWAGVPIPDSYQGRDLTSWLGGETPADWRTESFHEHIRLRPKISWEGVRTARWKYARYFDQAEDAEFLHDLAADPDELRNLADEPKHSEVLARFRARTDELVAEYGKSLPGSLYPVGQQPEVAAEAPTLQVFVLAGQSNMQGTGIVKADPERNEGRGTLEFLARSDEHRDTFGRLLDEDGNWVKRDDVWIKLFDRHGPLIPDYGARPGTIGPELGFGWSVGDHFDAPVLLIKVAWGGKSLARDFRPPSAGGEVGPSYRELFSEIRTTLEKLDELFPELEHDGFALRGIGWHQGWNDRINQQFNDAYADHLTHFIHDARRELDAPDLPFVIAETGMSGHEEKHPRALSLMAAQASVAERAEFRGNVAFVPTRDFWRPQEQSPSGQAYHWNNNAETFWLIGTAMGEAMIDLLDPAKTR